MHCLSAFVAKLRLVCHIRPHDFAFFLKRNIEKKNKVSQTLDPVSAWWFRSLKSHRKRFDEFIQKVKCI